MTKTTMARQQEQHEEEQQQASNVGSCTYTVPLNDIETAFNNMQDCHGCCDNESINEMRFGNKQTNPPESIKKRGESSSWMNIMAGFSSNHLSMHSRDSCSKDSYNNDLTARIAHQLEFEMSHGGFDSSNSAAGAHYTAGSGEDDDDDDEDNLIQRRRNMNVYASNLGRPSMSTAESGSGVIQHVTLRTSISFTVLVVLMGLLASGLFLWIAISSAEKTESERFELRASEFVKEIQTAFHDYEVACRWIHHACSSRMSGDNSITVNDNAFTTNTNGTITPAIFPRGHKMSHSEFRELYDYIHSDGLDFQAAEFLINVTREERYALEQESRNYYKKHHPLVSYRGIVGFEKQNNETVASSSSPPKMTIQSRQEQPFYFPAHYVEPVVGNEVAIDFDLYSSASRRETIDYTLRTWQPALTPRLQLVQETDSSAYSVLLMHPGVKLAESNPEYKNPRDIALLVIRIPALLQRAAKSQMESMSVYIYDCAHGPNEPVFLGGSVITADAATGTRNITSLTEVEYSQLKGGKSRLQEETVDIIKSFHWKIVVVALPGTFHANIRFAILAGCMMLVACICLALFIFTNMRRVAKINQVKMEAENEKASVFVKTAKKAAKRERDLNDFIAHEVRNPLAAALSACTFVASEIHETKPLVTETSRTAVREDIGIISSSLTFINDLLRNMLDMHRADSNQLSILLAPTNVLDDILEPVSAMLYHREANYQVILECEDNMVVMTDKLRMKQVILNLSRNATKFVQKGYIKLRCTVNNSNEVCLIVEDSGCGIPVEKRSKLFSKFQESLDTLHQGTGIGLYLCEKLVDLMDGEIWLDESFDSGIEGYPGSRFVINLKQSLMEYPISSFLQTAAHIDNNEMTTQGSPENIISTVINANSSKDHGGTDYSGTFDETRSCSSSTLNRSEDAAGTSEKKQFKASKGDERCSDNDTKVEVSTSIGLFSLTPLTQPQAQPSPDCPAKAPPRNNEVKQSNVSKEKENHSDRDNKVDVITSVGLFSLQPSPQPQPSQLSKTEASPINAISTTITDISSKSKDQNNINNTEDDSSNSILSAALSVLFVDDDVVLRKLFTRSVRKVVPNWQIQQAPNGETALQLCVESDKPESFDIIFLDQYMPTVGLEKTLLGSETARLLRSNINFPKNTIICGLSANDVEKAFYKAGADYFLFKPLPCKPAELKAELMKILQCRKKSLD